MLARRLSRARISRSATARPPCSPTPSPPSTPCEPSYRLGLLSNGSRLPETVGLAGYFESVVFAQDHRVAKPDKGIFEVVERELGVGPEVCVLVGDHPVNDVAGAHAAGWRSVWLDRDGAVLVPRGRPATRRRGGLLGGAASAAPQVRPALLIRGQHACG